MRLRSGSQGAGNARPGAGDLRGPPPAFSTYGSRDSPRLVEGAAHDLLEFGERLGSADQVAVDHERRSPVDTGALRDLHVGLDGGAVRALVEGPGEARRIEPEARGVLVDYTLCCVVRTPHYYVKNFGQIADQAIQPAMNQVWANMATPAEAMAEAVAAAAQMMAGRWDQ